MLIASRVANNLLIDNLLYPKIGHEYGSGGPELLPVGLKLE